LTPGEAVGAGPPNGQERRHDLDGRSRVTDLERRYRRVARLLFFALAFQALFVFFGMAALQDSRVDALRESCERDNREARALRSIVRGGNPELIRRVRGAFPIEDDCDAVARERAGTVINLPG
jgi:hypothetical protein